MTFGILIDKKQGLFRQGFKNQIKTSHRESKAVGKTKPERGTAELTNEEKSEIFSFDEIDFTALREFVNSYSELNIVILPAKNGNDRLHQKYRLETDGFLVKNLDASSLLELIEGLLQCENLNRQKTDSGLKNDLPNNTNHFCCEIDPLTNREEDVLKLVAVGKSNVIISEELHISINTVKTHVRNIYRKLQLNNRTQAANYALAHGVGTLFSDNSVK